MYLFISYVLLPFFWKERDRKLNLVNVPKVTTTKQGIPGDPVNISLVGTDEDIIHAFIRIGWSPADPITPKSSLKIAESVLLNRPDPDAPVSNLYLLGRKQDLAFEKLSTKGAREREHIRLWKSEESFDGRPVWLCAATFDRSVGISHKTGAITHHISPDIDQQRDRIIQDLQKAGQLSDFYSQDGIGPTKSGKNGGGDPYFTDGMMTIGILAVNTSAPLIGKQN